MKDILTFEEILEIVRTAAACGIRRIKITGGKSGNFVYDISE